MRTGRKSNNGGFSLVELIIVIAIMAILVGVMAISASSLTGRKVKKCADEIVSTSLIRILLKSTGCPVKYQMQTFFTGCCIWGLSVYFS